MPWCPLRARAARGRAHSSRNQRVAARDRTGAGMPWRPHRARAARGRAHSSRNQRVAARDRAGAGMPVCLRKTRATRGRAHSNEVRGLFGRPPATGTRNVRELCMGKPALRPKAALVTSKVAARSGRSTMWCNPRTWHCGKGGHHASGSTHRGDLVAKGRDHRSARSKCSNRGLEGGKGCKQRAIVHDHRGSEVVQRPAAARPGKKQRGHTMAPILNEHPQGRAGHHA